jgi:hypothetical protein
MPRKPQISVEPRGGGWAVQKDGTQRASHLTSTQDQAVRLARAQAMRERTELVIKNERGQIREKNSYGNDPRRSTG